MPAPFEGLKVLDFSQGEFGPYCGMLLADMGADVIKIERADIGEGMRHAYLSFAGPGLSYMWMGVNRGKRSLALNIKSDEGREIVYKLVKDADIVIQNFRPGVMDRLQLNYDRLSQINPKLIMASLSGYGEEGPLRERGGQDLLAQAHAGIIALMGDEGGPAQSVGSPIADGLGAITASWGIAVALVARERHGVGQEIHTNLVDSLLALSPLDWSEYLNTGVLHTGGRGWYPNMPYGPWNASDRAFVLNWQGEEPWPDFCALIGREDLVDDPRFRTNRDRLEHRCELQDILDPLFATKTQAEWNNIFESKGLRCDLVQNYRDLETHPHTKINKMIIEQEHSVYGKFRAVGQAIKLDKTPGAATNESHLPPPVLGEHSREILQSIGYSSDDVDALEERGIVNTRGLRAEAAETRPADLWAKGFGHRKL